MYKNNLYPYAQYMPQIDKTAYIAPGSRIIGRVTIGPRSSVWYNAVVRGDVDQILIGRGTNIQDNCTLHVDTGFPIFIGDNVVIGHNVVLHGCFIEDETLVGMGALILNGARIGRGSIIGAGAVVLEGMNIPPGQLVAGTPARVIRPVSPEDNKRIRVGAEHYLQIIDCCNKTKA